MLAVLSPSLHFSAEVTEAKKPHTLLAVVAVFVRRFLLS